MLVLVGVALWAAFTQRAQLAPTVSPTSSTPAPASTKVPVSERTAPLEGFIALPNLNLGGVWPAMTRSQILRKLGAPRYPVRDGWEDFGEVQIFWNAESESRALGICGEHLFDLKEPIVSIGDPLKKVIDRIGLPQELHSDSTGRRHVLNYVPNNLRITAAGAERGDMGAWKVERLNWGKSP